MKRSDIVRTIQVQFRHMRASDAAAILDTVSDHMIEAIVTGQHNYFVQAQPRTDQKNEWIKNVIWQKIWN